MEQKKDIEELVRKIAPVYPQKASDLWTLYLSAPDQKTRHSVENQINLLAQKTLGYTFQKNHILLPPEFIKKKRRDYKLGYARYKHLKQPFYLEEADLLRHIAIIGSTGSGKTTLSKQIIRGLISDNKPFLLCDWKRSYRELFEGTDIKHRIIPVAKPHLGKIAFNPLIPPPGTSQAAWNKLLADVLCQAFFIGEGVQYLITAVIDVTLKKHHATVSGAEPSKFPTLKDLLTATRSMKLLARQKLWQDSLMRVLFHLTYGPVSETLCAKGSDIEKLLNENVVLELDGLSQNSKMFIVSVLLLWIYQYRMNQPRQGERLKHVIIVEEAHHIFSSPKTDVPRITDIVFKEVRELGQGLIAISQTPSSLSHEVLSNSNTLISFAQRNQLDIQAAARSLLLDHTEFGYLGMLKTGQAVVKTKDALGPFLMEVPFEKPRSGSRALRNSGRITGASALSADIAPPPAYAGSSVQVPFSDKKHKPTTPDEDRLIEDILKHELCGVSVRCRRLGWSVRKLMPVINSLERKGYLKRVEIMLRRGKIVLFDLVSVNTRESIVHKFWKHRIAARMKQKGLDVETEYKTGAFRVDVVAKGRKHVAVEVETGCSDITLNLLKNLPKKFQMIVFAATSPEAYKKIQKIISDLGLNSNPRIKVMEARYFCFP